MHCLKVDQIHVKTFDGKKAQIDTYVYYKISDPVRSLTRVRNSSAVIDGYMRIEVECLIAKIVYSKFAFERPGVHSTLEVIMMHIFQTCQRLAEEAETSLNKHKYLELEAQKL